MYVNKLHIKVCYHPFGLGDSELCFQQVNIGTVDYCPLTAQATKYYTMRLSSIAVYNHNLTDELLELEFSFVLSSFG